MTPSQSYSLRFVRVVCLSIIYLGLVFVIGRQTSDWTISHTTGPTAGALTSQDAKRAGVLFVIANSLVFAGSLLWFARTRQFSPIARYLVPTVLAVVLTYIVLIPVAMIKIFPNPNAFVSNADGLVYWLDTVLPGIVAAQLFRFPGERGTTSSGDTPTPHAV
jgi:hypothetical protein